MITDCDSHRPALLDLFISSDASIFSSMAFPPLGNFDHVVSVSIDFPSNSQWDASFDRITYDYSRVDWDGFCDHLKDVPWEDIFKLGDSAVASEFCEGVHVGIDVYIPYCKCQVKPHSSPWFSATFSAVIVHRNHFFHLYQQNKSSESKVKFRQASNCCERVLEAAKLAYGTKTKEFITSLLYSMARRCCLLHLIKQNCLLKTFLRTLILMTEVSLYPCSFLELI